MTQTFLIFEADATQSYIQWHLVLNPDIAGYYLGCPPFLQGQAEAKGWIYQPPHVYKEEVELVGLLTGPLDALGADGGGAGGMGLSGSISVVTPTGTTNL